SRSPSRISAWCTRWSTTLAPERQRQGVRPRDGSGDLRRPRGGSGQEVPEELLRRAAPQSLAEPDQGVNGYREGHRLHRSADVRQVDLSQPVNSLEDEVIIDGVA